MRWEFHKHMSVEESYTARVTCFYCGCRDSEEDCSEPCAKNDLARRLSQEGWDEMDGEMVCPGCVREIIKYKKTKTEENT